MIRTGFSRALALAAAILALVVLPGRAAAHCDSMDGPVVRAARKALETNAVELALVWVQPSGEQEVRDAFVRAMRVRASGGDARELAELWFFETVVRVHRTGEGEPYTGLKPAGSEIPAGILAADRALDRGSIDELAEELAGRAARLLTERFQHVTELSAYDARDVAAGRRYVAAYVEYMHFIETLHALVTGAGGDHWSEHEGSR
jgi:hypothetical protein